MDNAIAKYISTWKGGTDENPDYRMLMDYKVLFCGTIFIRRVHDMSGPSTVDGGNT